MAKAINIVISGNAAPLRKTLDETDDLFKKSFGGIEKVALASAAAIAGAGALAFSAIQDAADLGETLSKTGVLFGKQSVEIEKFADKAATALGLTKQAALDGAATFATFGKSAGLSGTKLSGFSTKFVTLAGDLASFNNTTPEQAINAIGSALRGEAEPLRKFGVLLDDATLRQKALELGIVSTIKEALTPQEKVLAAQAAIFEQTTSAQGDFERTSGSLANQQKILTAELANVKTEIGVALLPIMETLVGFVRNTVVPIISNLSDTFSEEGLTGVLRQAREQFLKFVEEADGKTAVLINLAGTITVLAAAFKGFTIITSISASITVLTAQLSTLAAAVPFFIGATFGAIASVVALAAAGIYVLIDALRDPTFRQAFGEVLLNSLKGIANAFITVYKIIQAGINPLVSIANTISPFGDLQKLPDVKFQEFTNTPIYTPRSVPGAGVPGMGNNFSITVQAGVGDPREIGRQVVDAIKQFERTAGPVFQAA